MRHFAPPTLETVVVPGETADRGALRVALDQLAEQDPLIDVRQDDARGEVSLSLYGEVQKEVIQATLADDFGVDVTLPRVDDDLHRARRRDGVGRRDHRHRDEPVPGDRRPADRARAAPGAGITFALEVELGSMPYAFFRAVEETAARRSARASTAGPCRTAG